MAMSDEEENILAARKEGDKEEGKTRESGGGRERRRGGCGIDQIKSMSADLSLSTEEEGIACGGRAVAACDAPRCCRAASSSRSSTGGGGRGHPMSRREGADLPPASLDLGRLSQLNWWPRAGSAAGRLRRRRRRLACPPCPRRCVRHADLLPGNSCGCTAGLHTCGVRPWCVARALKKRRNSRMRDDLSSEDPGVSLEHSKKRNSKTTRLSFVNPSSFHSSFIIKATSPRK